MRAVVFLLVVLMLLPATGTSAAPVVHYRVRIFNLTSGQPFSPPVAATHEPSIRMFQVGALASPELEAIACEAGTSFLRSSSMRHVSGAAKRRRGA